MPKFQVQLADDLTWFAEFVEPPPGWEFSLEFMGDLVVWIDVEAARAMLPPPGGYEHTNSLWHEIQRLPQIEDLKRVDTGSVVEIILRNHSEIMVIIDMVVQDQWLSMDLMSTFMGHCLSSDTGERHPDEGMFVAILYIFHRAAFRCEHALNAFCILCELILSMPRDYMGMAFSYASYLRNTQEAPPVVG